MKRSCTLLVTGTSDCLIIICRVLAIRANARVRSWYRRMPHPFRNTTAAATRAGMTNCHICGCIEFVYCMSIFVGASMQMATARAPTARGRSLSNERMDLQAELHALDKTICDMLLQSVG